MKTVDVLIQAKALIADPSNWIQGKYYKKVVDGRECFCSLGAISKAMKPEINFDIESFELDWTNNEAEKLLSKVVNHGPTTFARYNDEHTHAEVMEAFDKAIELAKQEA
jgi:hypothetical protein